MATFSSAPEAQQQDLLKERKKKKLDEIRAFHKDLIEDLGITPLDFNMKMPFYDKQGRYVVGIFASEFKRDKGFFFELITRDLDPADPERKVYRVKPNNYFADEYALNEKGSYLVPLEELQIVNPTSVAISKASAVTSNDKLIAPQEEEETIVPAIPAYKAPAFMDAPISSLSVRDLVAILYQRPISSKDWLNDLIKQVTKK